jgi:D-glucosaminate-6-phosphate ammonia-lyase
MRELAGSLEGVPNARVQLVDRGEVPRVVLALDEAAAGISAMELVRRLESGSTPVYGDPIEVDQGRVIFAPTCLKEGEPQLIAERVHALLAGRPA